MAIETKLVVCILACGGYNPDFLGPPNPIDQLVAALCDAGLQHQPQMLETSWT